MNKFTLIISLHIITLTGFGQAGYIAKDKKLTSGLDVIDSSDYINAKFCFVRKGDTIKRYTAKDIDEYGTSKGRVYKSFNISDKSGTNMVFLELLSSGNLDLYSLKEEHNAVKYFLSNDTLTLTPIPSRRSELKDFLSEKLSSCPRAKKKVKFTGCCQSLTSLLNYYNDCANRPYQHFHIGFVLGRTYTDFKAIKKSSIYTEANQENRVGYITGFLFSIPLYRKNISLIPEISIALNHNNWSFDKNCYNSKAEYRYEIVSNNSSLRIPISIRYSARIWKIKPHIQAGIVYSRSIKDSETLIIYDAQDNNIYINYKNIDIYQKKIWGISYGTGITFLCKPKFSVFSDINFVFFSGNKTNPQTYNIQESSIRLGISF